MIEYRVLGALEVAAGEKVAELGPPKQRAVLAILILRANEVVPSDQLIDMIWGDHAPARAGHALQVYVSRLREALGRFTTATTILWRAPGYMLMTEREAVDAWCAERLVADGARLIAAGDLPRASAVLDQALGRWRGRPLADFTYEEFAQSEIRRLTETRLHGTELLATAELGMGHPVEALAHARTVVAEDPLREHAREIEMLALYRGGRAAEAIRTYEEYRRLLADELDVEPSPVLRQVGERIIVHDPALGLASAPPAAAPTPRNPYKGLRAFAEVDAAEFFGRTALVDELVRALADGKRMVSLVGPSGSGKSSVMEAGLIPALRSGRVPGSEGWAIERLRLDAEPLRRLEAATARARADRDLVLVIDQLERICLEASDDERSRFLAALAATATDAAGTRVVLALRADVYDRPLADPRIAHLFAAGVVNVVPLTPANLEAAIVEPARRAGVVVDPALLAELISDTAGRFGALPLLQHALATLFDRRTGSELGLEAYRDLGGIRGALKGRAECVFQGLSDTGRVTARHVFLRLAGTDVGDRRTGRRVSLRELSTLDLDAVELSHVLRAFERERLVTFDRDTATGDATVEVAHEALFVEWDRLASWVDECRLDLRRHGWLTVRVGEWLAGGRAVDDLLTGPRLDEYEGWRAATGFALTGDEHAFLDASLLWRDTEAQEMRGREIRERALERRAHVRLLGLVAAAVVLVVGSSWALLAWPGAAPDIVLVYPGTDRGGMYASIAQGFDRATSDLDRDVQAIVQDPGAVERGWPDLETRLRRLADQGVDLIVVGFAWSYPHVHRAASDHPETLFLAVDYRAELPNVAVPVFGAEEGAYLVGAAAALRTETGTVAIVTESDSDIEWPYVAGFEAGARQVDPDVDVIVAYGYDPFTEPTPELTVVDISRAAREVYRAGADVVFYSGEQSPIGLFDAAYRQSQATGRHLWAVARDADWYAVLPAFSTDGGADVSAWRSHVLTSLITRWDTAISTMLEDYARQELRSGARRFGLADGGYDLSPSGGAIDDILPQLKSLAERIASGEIAVPSEPLDRGPIGRAIEPTLSGALERDISRAERPGRRRQMS